MLKQTKEMASSSHLFFRLQTTHLLDLPCCALDRIIHFLFDPTTRKDRERLAPLPVARKSLCNLALSTQSLRSAVFRGFVGRCNIGVRLFDERDKKTVWECIRVWSRGTISLTNAKKTYLLTQNDLGLLQSRKRNNGWNRMTSFLELEVFVLALKREKKADFTRDVAYSSFLERKRLPMQNRNAKRKTRSKA
jgi:hypothetical protein